MKYICFFGDGLIQGVGDRHHVGWPEHLAVSETEAVRKPDAASPFYPQDQLSGDGVTAYSLGVAWDTSADIRLRWRDEAMARLLTQPQAGLVFSFGFSDMASSEQSGMQLSLWDSAVHAEAMISEAAHEWPVLWVGPPPIVRQPPPIRVNGEVFHASAARLQALNDAYAEVAARCKVPYLNLIEILQHSPRWYEALDDGNGVFPSAQGHHVIAREVGRWDAWRQWIDQGFDKAPGCQVKQLPPQTLLTPKMVAMGY
jgi:lysophospholipase L1-like esterase